MDEYLNALMSGSMNEQLKKWIDTLNDLKYEDAKTIQKTLSQLSKNMKMVAGTIERHL